MDGPFAMSRRRALLAAAAALPAIALPGVAWATKPLPSQILSYRLQNGHYSSAGGWGRTFSSQYQLESPPNRVRLIWFNDTTGPITIDAAAVAPTSGPHDGMVPLDADGAAAPGLWRPVTFADAAPGQPHGPLTIQADPVSDGQPSVAVSDWIDVAGMARRDGGAGAFLLVRSYSRGLLRFSPDGPPDVAVGQAYRAGWSDGNGAAPPYALASVHPDPSLHACYGLQYVAGVPGISVIGIGDSIMQSLRTTHSVSGFGVRACAMLSTPQRPVSYFNEGYSGRKSVDFATDGLRDLALLRPQVALIQAWSENDSWTRAAADASLDLARRVVDATRQVGGAPILVTAAPVFRNKPAAEVFRRRSNDAVRAMAGPSLPVLDLDAIWGTGSDPNAYRTQYDSGEATHPNDAAAVAAATALSLVLQKIIA